jgi:hypothetical protein
MKPGFIGAFEDAPAQIHCGGNLASVSIGGSLVGGTINHSGEIISNGNIGSVKIGGNLLGSSIAFNEPSLDSTGYIQGAHIGSVFIGGSIIAGVDTSTGGSLTKNASIRATDDIGSITVKGAIVGNVNPNGVSLVVISGRGQHGLSATATTDVALGNINVAGRVEWANLLAGYDTSLALVNLDAQVGSVVIGGDWISTNLIAGVNAGIDGQFGTVDDMKIKAHGVKDNPDNLGAVSRIASVIIKGNAIGTLTPDDPAAFGIEAQHIVLIKLGGATVPLLPGPSNDTVDNDRAHPLTITTGSGNTSDGFDFHAFEV